MYDAERRYTLLRSLYGQRRKTDYCGNCIIYRGVLPPSADFVTIRSHLSKKNISYIREIEYPKLQLEM